MAPHTRLRGLRRHLAPAPVATDATVPESALTDMHENRWTLRGGALTVTPPPGGGERQAVAIPPELQDATAAPPALAVDDNGFVWICAPGSRHLFRLNPRGPGHNGGGTGPAVFAPQQRWSPDTAAHLLWQRFDPAVLPAPITTIACLT